MNIYLDIDGVLLKKDGTLANYFDEFLKFVVENHDVFWLTTHCRGGENRAIEHITQRNVVSGESLALMEKIQPTDWGTWKTDAIDFVHDFLWLDDCLFDSEKAVLEKNRVLEKLMVIDLNGNPDQLLSLIKK